MKNIAADEAEFPLEIERRHTLFSQDARFKVGCVIVDDAYDVPRACSSWSSQLARRGYGIKVLAEEARNMCAAGQALSSSVLGITSSITGSCDPADLPHLDKSIQYCNEGPITIPEAVCGCRSSRQASEVGSSRQREVHAKRR